jgi:hypothetical protein
MRKYGKKLIGITLALAMLVSMSACLDVLDYDSDWLFDLDLSGDFTFTDVTAAVLIMTNWSSTTRVTEVRIDQTNGNESAPPRQYTSSFRGKPGPLERKAVYLNPSEHNYRVEIDYEFTDDNGISWTEGAEVFEGPRAITVPLPRDVVQMHIFRNEDGEVIIEIETGGGNKVPADPPDHACPDDTGRPKPDPLPGEGSVPAVIPAEYRNRMGTAIVVNMTNSMPVYNVNFTMADRDYDMGSGRVRDSQSIALGQGTW